MTGECQELVTNAVAIGVLCGATIGILLGSWLEARNWRASAADFRRRESGGRLFVVSEEQVAQEKPR